MKDFCFGQVAKQSSSNEDIEGLFILNCLEYLKRFLRHEYSESESLKIRINYDDKQKKERQKTVYDKLANIIFLNLCTKYTHNGPIQNLKAF